MKFDRKILSTSYTRIDNKVVYTIDGQITIADKRYLIRTRGVAKCSPQDEFNFDFGIALAGVRARQRFYRIMEKRLIKYSNKNSKPEPAYIQIGNDTFKLVRVV